MKNHLHYLRCTFGECLGWQPSSCDIYEYGHLGPRNAAPAPLKGRREDAYAQHRDSAHNRMDAATEAANHANWVKLIEHHSVLRTWHKWRLLEDMEKHRTVSLDPCYKVSSCCFSSADSLLLIQHRVSLHFHCTAAWCTLFSHSTRTSSFSNFRYKGDFFWLLFSAETRLQD
jgi:hypothetical protein